jgi:hypothetical protein
LRTLGGSIGGLLAQQLRLGCAGLLAEDLMPEPPLALQETKSE